MIEFDKPLRLVVYTRDGQPLHFHNVTEVERENGWLSVMHTTPGDDQPQFDIVAESNILRISAWEDQ